MKPFFNAVKLIALTLGTFLFLHMMLLVFAYALAPIFVLSLMDPASRFRQYYDVAFSIIPVFSVIGIFVYLAKVALSFLIALAVNRSFEKYAEMKGKKF